MVSVLQAFEQLRHRGVQTSGDHLQGDDPHFALALLNVRDVSPVHIQVDREVGLGQCLAFP